MTTSTRALTVPPLDAQLLAVAQGQHGMLTTFQARAAGLSPPLLVALVKSGVLRHPGRGLYAVGAMAETDPQKWHRQLCAGAFLLYPDAVLAGTTAVLAHGVPVWGAPLVVPTITRPIKRAGGVGAFWVRPARGAVVDSDWGRASAPADALVQHAIDRGIVPGVVSADAALRTGTVTETALADAVARVRSWPHASHAASMLLFVDGRRESVGESRCAVAMAMAGIEVTPQVLIVDEDGEPVGRVDFLVTGTNVIVEFDGKVKYASGDPDVLWKEKRREDRLRRLGYVVVRLTWADLERPGGVAAAVRRALKAA
jgi:very-short-patch-repair endonuclease